MLRKLKIFTALTVSLLIATILLREEVLAYPYERAFCKYGEQDPDTCGCKCSGLLVLQGKDCVCPENVCVTDYYSYGTADKANNCSCSCPTWATMYGPGWCSWVGGSWDAAKCGCSCSGDKYFNSTEWKCRCKATPDCSLQGKIFDENTCLCICDTAKAAQCNSSGGSMSSSCECGGCTNGKILVDGLCQCPPHDPVGANQVWNENTCQPDCVSGAYQKYGNACYLKNCFQDSTDCLASERLFNENAGTCSCPVVVQ